MLLGVNGARVLEVIGYGLVYQIRENSPLEKMDGVAHIDHDGQVIWLSPDLHADAREKVLLQCAERVRAHAQRMGLPTL
jgi:hypothetical protein